MVARAWKYRLRPKNERFIIVVSELKGIIRRPLPYRSQGNGCEQVEIMQKFRPANNLAGR